MLTLYYVPLIYVVCTSLFIRLRNKSTGQLISWSIYILGQVMVIHSIMAFPVDMGIRSNLPPHLHIWDYGWIILVTDWTEGDTDWNEHYTKNSFFLSLLNSVNFEISQYRAQIKLIFITKLRVKNLLYAQNYCHSCLSHTWHEKVNVTCHEYLSLNSKYLL
jgi:hypothetical protein